MIISTKKGTPKDELEKIVDKFEKQGLDVTLITGKDYNVFGLVGDTTKIDERDVLANPWIDNVTRVSAPYKRANRLFHPADSVIDCGGVKIGGKEKIAVMAGPCSIEGAEQALRIGVICVLLERGGGKGLDDGAKCAAVLAAELLVFIAAAPYAGGVIRGVADKPDIVIVAGGTALAGCRHIWKCRTGAGRADADTGACKNTVSLHGIFHGIGQKECGGILQDPVSFRLVVNK